MRMSSLFLLLLSAGRGMCYRGRQRRCVGCDWINFSVIRLMLMLLLHRKELMLPQMLLISGMMGRGWRVHVISWGGGIGIRDGGWAHHHLLLLLHLGVRMRMRHHQLDVSGRINPGWLMMMGRMGVHHHRYVVRKMRMTDGYGQYRIRGRR